jgi:type II secretory pathway component HofQ
MSLTPDEAMSRMSIGILKALGEPDRVELDLKNAGIEQVAKALSTAFDVNVIVTDPEKITKRATIHMSQASVEDALDAICRAMDCTYKKDGDTYVITPR